MKIIKYMVALVALSVSLTIFTQRAEAISIYTNISWCINSYTESTSFDFGECGVTEAITFYANPAAEHRFVKYIIDSCNPEQSSTTYPSSGYIPVNGAFQSYVYTVPQGDITHSRKTMFQLFNDTCVPATAYIKMTGYPVTNEGYVIPIMFTQYRDILFQANSNCMTSLNIDMYSSLTVTVQTKPFFAGIYID